MPVIAAYLYRHGRRVLAIAIDERVDCPSDRSEFVWIGLTDPCTQEVDQLRRLYGLHPLAVEDSLRDGQLPKVDVWAAILAVPTAIAGIYGTNFDHMPELHSPYGYPVTLGVILTACVTLYWQFRKVRWLEAAAGMRRAVGNAMRALCGFRKSISNRYARLRSSAGRAPDARSYEASEATCRLNPLRSPTNAGSSSTPGKIWRDTGS